MNKCVYEHWRLDRDECFYVGQGSPERPYSRKQRNAHWWNIVKKLERIGSGYEVRLVATGLAQEKAFELEIERIIFWQDKVDLANILPGGQNGGGGMTGRKHSPETIEKMRKAQKGRIITEEAKEKLRVANLGKKASTEMKLKMSLSRKGKKRPEVSKPVICLTDGKIFPSGNEAGKFYGILPMSISACCHGKIKSTRSLQFSFAEDVL